jgi:hypothetical protein
MHPGPYLNEFAVRVPNAPAVHRRLLGHGVLAGLVLAEAEPDDPALADGLLVCATETTTPDEIALFAWALGEELAAGEGGGHGALRSRRDAAGDTGDGRSAARALAGGTR